MTVFEEKEGVFSMRRLLAFYYSLLSGGLLIVGAIYGTMAGIYGGLGCALVVLVLLGLTTISDIKSLGYSFKEVRYATEERNIEEGYSGEYPKGD